MAKIIRKSRKIVHKNRIFAVEKLILDKNGKTVDNFRVVKPNTVAVLPLIGKDKILMEIQYRAPIEKTIYEIPAGHMNKGEKPIQTAKRELEEETGYKCSKLTHLLNIYPSPGLMNGKEYVYLAEGLGKGKVSLDEDEFIELKAITLSNAVKLIKSGKITDAKTVVAILYYLLMRKA